VQELNALAQEADYFYRKRHAAPADIEKHLGEEARARLGRFAERLEALEDWSAMAIHDLFKPFCADEGIKMGLLGMPLRVMVCGTTQTPSVDAVLALIGKQEVLRRLRA
jgi:glutamyl-tRNA synthetase